MVSETNGNKPVIEANPQGDAPEVTLRALKQRIRQQELLSELGVLALQNSPFLELIDRTAIMTAEGLGADYSKVLQFIPSEQRLLVIAGFGWPPGVVGRASVGADLASPAGYALRTGKPVISNHLENEERFRTPELLVENGVRRAVNVIMQGDGAPFGVLEADSRSEGEFIDHDIAFLQGAANLLGMAIERQRHESNLRQALDRQLVLVKEINHRVKNSLSIVSSMLNMQARTSADAGVKRILEEAAGRVVTIARAHQHLYQSTDVEQLDLGIYLKEVCEILPGHGDCTILVEAGPGIKMATDRAIPLALILVELVTNAVKYAYDGKAGPISVNVGVEKGEVSVYVRDQGRGLPEGFDLNTSSGFGMRIVQALAAQLDASVTAIRHDNGAEFAVRAPLVPPAS